jgi:hypothetical protein
MQLLTIRALKYVKVDLTFILPLFCLGSSTLASSCFFSSSVLHIIECVFVVADYISLPQVITIKTVQICGVLQ